MRLQVFALLALAFVAGGKLSAFAAGDLPQPTGEVILTVTGQIASTNAPGGASFDRAMLESLGLHRLETTTTWTDGVKTFEGVMARDLLARVAAQGDTVRATALNDYEVTIPIEDFQKYDVLLAMRMDGQELLTRDKGPLWIVYPRDQNPELRDARYDHRWAWQLAALHVE